jgi:hypothetical protein
MQVCTFLQISIDSHGNMTVAPDQQETPSQGAKDAQEISDLSQLPVQETAGNALIQALISGTCLRERNNQA